MDILWKGLSTSEQEHTPDTTMETIKHPAMDALPETLNHTLSEKFLRGGSPGEFVDPKRLRPFRSVKPTHRGYRESNQRRIPSRRILQGVGPIGAYREGAGKHTGNPQG